MSILIKGMEMPENCWKCPMANTYSGYGPLQGCFAVQGKEYACIDEPYDTHYKPSWCPLIEIKEPDCETVVIKTPMPKFMKKEVDE